MGRPVWSRKKIIASIKELGSNGKNLAPKTVLQLNPSLYRAAVHHIGSWREALETAGYDYDAIIAAGRRKTMAYQRPKGYWNAARVLQKIRERQLEGRPLNSGSVQVDDRGLYAAAIKYLGSWGRAVEKATGMPYDAVRLIHAWTEGEIIEAIRDMYARGETLYSGTVAVERPGLYSSARVHFGSWREAIEAAGLEYLGVGTSWQWERETLARALRKWAASDEMGLPRRMESAVRRWHDSWEQALTAAGVDPSILKQKRLRQIWSRKRVSRELRQRAKRGESLLYSDVYRENPRLVRAAQRWYGSWTKARSAVLGIRSRHLTSWLPKQTR